MLAQIDNPELDVRNPYTKIGGSKSFSGRTYDETYLTQFINKYKLPCIPTTGFLTPALRNLDKPLTTSVTIVGRPPRVYKDTLQILDDVAEGRVSAEDVLTYTIGTLLAVRKEQVERIAALLSEVKQAKQEALPLSSEAIVRLIEQHLASKNASRLPVLVVAAAYKTAEDNLGERALPLNAHNAADKQTGAMGDIEICLVDDDKIVTIYEMKTRRISIDDVNAALEKIAESKSKVDNYIFITTESIDVDVREYSTTLYEKTGGTELAVLDCIGFLRHFLHLFHRIRNDFLDNYQEMVLAEPVSAVNQPLKEAFLSLRQAALAEG
jgi:hypothetical protein